MAPKNITLPRNTATLTPTCGANEHKKLACKYEWTLIDYMGDTIFGEFSGDNEEELKLANLEEGTYRFNVTIWASDSNDLIGQDTGVVTVSPGTP